MHFWNHRAIVAIGNVLGIFIDKVNPKNKFSYARIYVEVDLEEGLLVEIKLNLSGWIHMKMLDFD